MADSEWFCVEMSDGRQLSGTDQLKLMPNRESAVTAARNMAPNFDDTLTVVKYTRKEIRTFKKKVTVDEADVPS